MSRGVPLHWVLILTIILALISLGLSKRVRAEPMSTQAEPPASWLVAGCTQAKNSKYADGYCTGFIEGTYNSIDPWCVPEELTYKELRELIIAELGKIDAKEAVPASDAIKDIIRSKWPCTYFSDD